MNARLPLRSKRQSNVYDRIAAATGGDAQRFATASELADKVEEDLMVKHSFYSSAHGMAVSWKNKNQIQNQNIELFINMILRNIYVTYGTSYRVYV